MNRVHALARLASRSLLSSVAPESLPQASGLQVLLAFLMLPPCPSLCLPCLDRFLLHSRVC